MCFILMNAGINKENIFLLNSSHRVNQGPTKGFEKDVGSKTTHRLIYPESAYDVENTTHLVLVAFKPLDLEWLHNVFTTHRVRK